MFLLIRSVNKYVNSHATFPTFAELCHAPRSSRKSKEKYLAYGETRRNQREELKWRSRTFHSYVGTKKTAAPETKKLLERYFLLVASKRRNMAAHVMFYISFVYHLHTICNVRFIYAYDYRIEKTGYFSFVYNSVINSVYNAVVRNNTASQKVTFLFFWIRNKKKTE